MEIVYLIGNGFDVNIGLHTTYFDFYKYYSRIESKNELITEFKQLIKNYVNKKESGEELSDDEINWSDLEVALGKYCKEFEDKKSFDIIFKDLLQQLSNYLLEEEKSIVINQSSKSIMENYLCDPTKYMSAVGARDHLIELKKYTASDWNIKIITYNYTRTIERIMYWNNQPMLLGSSMTRQRVWLRGIEHIHGYTNSRMVLGVNDEKQVDNPNLIKNKYFRNAFIKSECNNAQGTLHKENCEEIINKANVIYMFGLSIGITDKYWWEAIVKAIDKNNSKLVIFTHTKREVGGIFSYEKQEVIDETIETFFKNAGVDDILQNKIRKNIIVEVNSSIFKINVSKNEKQLSA